MGDIRILIDRPRFTAERSRIYMALAEIEKIVSRLSCRAALEPVLQAAREGGMTTEPHEIFFYIYGAIHALGLDGETWELIDEKLDQIRP